MRLSELLAALPPELGPRRIGPDEDPVIRGLTYDSRRVASGDLFVALRGANADGHAFLAQALERGAAALLIEKARDGLAVPGAVVLDARRALACLARRFFGDPAGELRLIGITGTNGKTSTSFLVDSILRAAGLATGLIGTIGISFGDTWERAENTTPESLDLQRTLRAMRTDGVTAVSMEVSSHGLALGRVAGCAFEVAAITNLTQDHLDFHGDMASYRDAKRLLFSQHLRPEGTGVVNVDDPSADSFVSAIRERGARLVRVSRRADCAAEVRVREARGSARGCDAVLALPSGELPLRLPLVGDFNVENLIVAVGVALGLGLEPDVIARGVESCPQVPGRTERIESGAPDAPTVLVDYAHTPDAVEKLLQAVRPLATGRVITVFGCGGDRDRSKRPIMAEAVARYSDRAIATSDNPRTESPEAILRDLEGGLSAMKRVAPEALDATERATTSLVDRREAIALAIEIAQPEDTVVLAGKGHEDYQIVGREKLPFDDREEARRALRRRAR